MLSDEFWAPEAESQEIWTGTALPYQEQDKEDAPFVSFRAAEKIAPNDSEASMKFIRTEIQENDSQWLRRCLSLQRQARGLPAVFPTALSAALATPKEERIPFADAKRGMVGFCFDARIPGTAGHVFSIHGLTKSQIMLTGSNDVKTPGQVNYVPLSFYSRKWGHTMQFAATMLNGYDFSDFNKPPEPIKQGTLGERYADAMETLQRIERDKRKKGMDKLADAVARDIARMQRKLDKWG